MTFRLSLNVTDVRLSQCLKADFFQRGNGVGYDYGGKTCTFFE